MSHKSGHVIIESLRATEKLTPAEVTAVALIEARDQYTWQERLYLARLVYRVTSP